MEMTPFKSPSQGMITTTTATGGAIVFFQSAVVINGSNFSQNKNEDGNAGVMALQKGSLLEMYYSTFYNNSAKWFGGVLTVESATAVMSNCTFYNSSSLQGGVMDISKSYTTISESLFIFNTAATLHLYFGYGGVISADQKTHLNMNSCMFSNNSALAGGAISAVNTNITIADSIFQESHARLFGGVLVLFQCELTIVGVYKTIIHGNLAGRGGAIYAIETTLNIFNETIVISNVAEELGGSMYLYHSEFNCHHGCNLYIKGNRANRTGGGIHATNSLITVYCDRHLSENSFINFEENEAEKGGGICLDSASQLRIQKTGNLLPINKAAELYFKSNKADFGRAIFVVDETYYDVCLSKTFSSVASPSTDCFIQVLSPSRTINGKYNLTSINFVSDNSSDQESTIYGGLLDRCTSDPSAEVLLADNVGVDGVTYLKLISNIDDSNVVSSAPVKLCFCTESLSDHIMQPDCGYVPSLIKVKKGENFNVSLVAVDQVNHTLESVMIHSSLKYPESGLGDGELTQRTGRGCTHLKFRIYSPHSSEVLILYPEGPCRNVTRSRSTLRVSLQPCTCSKIGFKPKNSSNASIACECGCDSKLRAYINNCDYQTGLLNRSGNPWIAYMVKLGSYVTYRHCPLDYCVPNVPVNLNTGTGLDDSQCANNRSGLLCGVCRPKYSLSLGSSLCLECPKHTWYKTFIVVLVTAIVAGIILVAALMALNLTVAMGTLNGIIFYANIIGANSGTIIPSSTKSVSIFVSWLNLEVGFDICFFEGMDTYWKMWLQLAFPLYVILLVVSVILISKRSIKFSRLIAKRNPVATLATLILLSYTMFLRTIIAALSFAELDYPDGSKRWVWLPDASLEYFGWRHTVLFVVAIIILLMGIVFTSLLFFWQWILHHQNKIIFKWARSQILHHFLEPYHAPYRFNHRYWTGLLLFARVILYLVFALNASDDPSVNFLAISLLIVAILFLRSHTGRIYKSSMFDWLELLCQLNAGLFSVLQLYLLKSGSDLIIDVTAYITGIITFVALLIVIAFHMWKYCCSMCSKTCKLCTERRMDESIQENLVNHQQEDDSPIITPTFSVLDGLPHGDQSHPNTSHSSNLLHLLPESEDDNNSIASVDSSSPLFDGTNN